MRQTSRETVAIRQAYFESKVKSFVFWLDHFDRNLKSGNYEICLDLLDDARLNNFAAGEIETRYVDSRDGALTLCQGIVCHQAYDYSQAESYYIKGMEIHKNVGNVEGQGQALQLLNILKHDLSVEQVSLSVLQELAKKPWVLENDGAYLTRQLQGSNVHYQQKILQIALETGHLEPLQDALFSKEEVISASAACAMCQLTPGPDHQSLIELLTHPNAIVRWRSSSLLGDRLESGQLPADQIALIMNQMQAILPDCLSSEKDPLVKCEIAYLTGLVGDRGWCVDLLTPLLSDPDIDVRAASIIAMGKLGKAQHIPLLEHVQEGSTYRFNGWDLSEHVAQSIDRIKSAIPSVSSLYLYSSSNNRGNRSQSAKYFYTTDKTIEIRAIVRNLFAGDEVTAQIHLENKLYRKQVLMATAGESPRLKSSVVVIPLKDTELEFKFRPKINAWPAGKFRASILINGVIVKEIDFTMVSHPRFSRCDIYSQKNPQRGTLFGSGTYELVFKVTAENIALGSVVRAQLMRGAAALKLEESTRLMRSEGTASVEFAFKRNWNPGNYAITVKTDSPESEIFHQEFRIASRFLLNIKTWPLGSGRGLLTFIFVALLVMLAVQGENVILSRFYDEAAVSSHSSLSFFSTIANLPFYWWMLVGLITGLLWRQFDRDWQNNIASVVSHVFTYGMSVLLLLPLGFIVFQLPVEAPGWIGEMIRGLSDVHSHLNVYWPALVLALALAPVPMINRYRLNSFWQAAGVLLVYPFSILVAFILSLIIGAGIGGIGALIGWIVDWFSSEKNDAALGWAASSSVFEVAFWITLFLIIIGFVGTFLENRPNYQKLLIIMASAFVIGIVFDWVVPELSSRLSFEILNEDRILQAVIAAARANLFFWVLGGIGFGLIYIQKDEYIWDFGDELYAFVHYTVLIILGAVANYLISLAWFIPALKYQDALWGLPTFFLWYKPMVPYVSVGIILLIAVSAHESHNFDLDIDEDFPIAVPAIVGINMLCTFLFGVYVWVTFLPGGLILGTLGWLAGAATDLIFQGHDYQSIWSSFSMMWGARISPLLVFFIILRKA